MVDTVVGYLRESERRWKIGLISGPNLSNLGKRQSEMYGDFGKKLTLPDLEGRVSELAALLGVEVVPFASNYEGAILEWLHNETSELHGLIFNPAGLTLYGSPTRHALIDTGLPVIECHFGNIAAIDYIDGRSIFTKTVVGSVHGLRKHSYTAALVAMIAMLDDQDFAKPPEYEASRYTSAS